MTGVPERQFPENLQRTPVLLWCASSSTCRNLSMGDHDSCPDPV